MADFIFRVDSIQLSESQQQKIASAIQGAVLTELARLDLQGDQPKKAASGSGGVGSFLYNPIRWKGGMLLKAEEVAGAVESVLSVSSTAANQRTAA